MLLVASCDGMTAIRASSNLSTKIAVIVAGDRNKPEIAKSFGFTSPAMHVCTCFTNGHPPKRYCLRWSCPCWPNAQWYNFFLPEPSSSQPLQMMGGEGKGIGPQGVNSRPAIGPGKSEIPPSQYNLDTPTMLGGGNCKYTRVHCMQQALCKAEPGH